MSLDSGISKQRPMRETHRWQRTIVRIVAVVAANASIAACSQGADDRPIRGISMGDGGEGGEPGNGGAGGAGGTGGSTEKTTSDAVCVTGAKKECTIYIGENNGVVTCFKGVQVCENGLWGACG